MIVTDSVLYMPIILSNNLIDFLGFALDGKYRPYSIIFFMTFLFTGSSSPNALVQISSKIISITSFEGSLIVTYSILSIIAALASIYPISSKVVAPISLTCPLAIAVLKLSSPAVKPSIPILCISSINRTMSFPDLFWKSMISLNNDLMLEPNSLLPFAPIVSRSIDINIKFESLTLLASVSTTCVLPTPAKPLSSTFFIRSWFNIDNISVCLSSVPMESYLWFSLMSWAYLLIDGYPSKLVIFIHLHLLSISYCAYLYIYLLCPHDSLMMYLARIFLYQLILLFLFVNSKRHL